MMLLIICQNLLQDVIDEIQKFEIPDPREFNFPFLANLFVHLLLPSEKLDHT